MNDLEHKMRQQDETIKRLENTITTQIAEVIENTLKDSGVETKVEVLQGQYETKQELVKIKGQVAGMENTMSEVMETIRAMKGMMEQKLDSMTRDHKRQATPGENVNVSKFPKQSLSRRAGHQ